MRILACGLLLVLVAPVWCSEMQGSAPAQTLQGAQAVLRNLTITDAKIEPASKNFAETLRGLEHLAPGKAAAGWIESLARYQPGVPAHEIDELTGGPVNFSSWVARLPPKSQWQAMQATLAKLTVHDQATKYAVPYLLLSLLTNDTTAQTNAVKLQLANENSAAQKLALTRLQDVLDGRTDRAAELRAFVRTLTAKSATDVAYNDSEAGNVPDLVSLQGAKAARLTLQRALAISEPALAFAERGATAELARSLVLDTTQTVKAAPWSLVRGPQAAEIYAVLEKRFPTAAANALEDANASSYMSDYKRKEAQMQAIFTLAANGKVDEANRLFASAVASDASSVIQTIRQFRRSGLGAKLYPMTQYWLANSTRFSADLWAEHLAVAALAGETKAAIAAIQSRMREAPSAKQRLALLQPSADALLADNQVELAVSTLKEVIAGPSEDDSALRAAIKLANLGRVLNRPQDLSFGQQQFERLYQVPVNTEQESYERTELQQAILAFYLNSGQIANAEKWLIARLAELRKTPEQMRYFAPNWWLELLAIYHRAGRSSDVLALLQDSPTWGAADLSEIVGNATLTDGLPLGYMAAAALAKTGARAQAITILEQLLARQPSIDPAYALYVELQGANSLPFLETLYARDQFEERPLIWRSIALFEAGKIDEAEKAARAAIAIDPSDGEQKYGNRMRVYQSLAGILRAKGNEKDAAVFDGVIKTIRISEQADALRELGLHSAAVKLYSSSLDFFADAYCVQSRLAIELANLGRTEEAAIHYERAFSLMPDSFGRMESHCFGCEGVFNSAQSQTIADKTFAKMRLAQPRKAQIPYLQGYLKESMGDYAGARDLYRQAVQMDGQYLNAWKRLLDIKKYTALAPGEASLVSLELLKLDPLQRHITEGLAQVTDLGALWSITLENQAYLPKYSQQLLVLEASKQAMAADKSDTRDALFRQMMALNGASASGQARAQPPGMALVNTDLVRLLSVVLGEAEASRMERY